MAEKLKNKRKSYTTILLELVREQYSNFDFSKIKVPKITTNFYLVSSIFFVLWMLFFDSNDVFSQYERRKTLKDLENDKKFYEDGIKEIELKREKLSTNVRILERFARENYFLKKPGEDVYIIEEEVDSTEIKEAMKFDSLYQKKVKP